MSQRHVVCTVFLNENCFSFCWSCLCEVTCSVTKNWQSRWLGRVQIWNESSRVWPGSRNKGKQEVSRSKWGTIKVQRVDLKVMILYRLSDRMLVQLYIHSTDSKCYLLILNDVCYSGINPFRTLQKQSATLISALCPVHMTWIVKAAQFNYSTVFKLFVADHS